MSTTQLGTVMLPIYSEAVAKPQTEGEGSRNQEDYILPEVC